ncbi:leucine-rich repeat-containing protein 24 [Cephus cinctus]|uniref:Leucine-rich repeat-containing protein 24 n=1 Tax=Cephus cinctus TaxID=211228 RepID=A0AAJ7RRD2_CEPCN|nr:leucine-rich repeat-containing protein 24 [Cephus cinctus]XP_024945262.1 leucine-rich repeat-containing protein 24 [Cephus cinctus]XP_024945263.1 leucine-rich repeat-containing protein 24 [Cephus cinctus]XP_024945264.1 leucine-rich repeat-containing protein 24 [Cephus cinctus]XP_024945265.1 leucine-rich repeat-containing protein 24 [Cephus cinctus]XP_024945266.1 leucine-rich repeat-containing protein 24 [Cephus cinctus]XP_024945267.1 leucine-rich repeat-containing protein 24 [Cephus cinctu
METSRAMEFLCLVLMVAVCVGQEDWGCQPPCKCKWVSGKRTAECIRHNLTQIPNSLSSEIQILDMTGNRLGHLDKRAFSRVNLINIHKLILKECSIETIHVEAFRGLQIVIEIDLSMNKIKVLNPGTFAETVRLRILLLNHNEIEVLKNELFNNMRFLQKVVLSNNRLKHIGNKTFHDLPDFKSLKLDGNNLVNVKLKTFENLPKLFSLELHNNPWNCNCHLKAFRDWTIERKLYTQPTTCQQPRNLAGKMWNEISSDEFACRPEIQSVGPMTRLEIGRGDVTLWCRGSGVPQPQMYWYHRSHALTNHTKRHSGDDARRGYIITEGNGWLNLTIPDVSLSDKGDYICMANSTGGLTKKNVTVSVLDSALDSTESVISLPLAIGLGVIALLLLFVTLILCICYCLRRRTRHDVKSAEATSLEHHGLGEQEKSLITAVNPVVKPPRRYEAPSVTSHGTETTEINRTLLDNDSVFAGSGVGGGDCGGGVGGVDGDVVGDEERERATSELDNRTLSRGTTYRQYPPDLLAFSGGRGASPTSQASTAPDSSRLPNQLGSAATSGPVPFGSPFGSPSSGQYPAAFKTLPHNRSVAPYSPGLPVMPRHGYVTIPRRPRAPSWSSGPPMSPDGLEPIYDNLGLRTTADGSSVLSLNKSPEPSNAMKIRNLPGTPTSHYNTIQRSTPNILTSSPLDRAAPEGAPEWPSKLADEMDDCQMAGTLGRKVPPRPPPKPKKKSANGPLYEDEGEDGTEV